MFPGRVVSILLGALAVFGCERGDLFDRSASAGSVVLLESSYVVRDGASGDYVQVDLSQGVGGSHALRRTRFWGGTLDVRPSAASDALIVLSPDSATLVVQPADGGEGAEYDLEQPFNDIVLSEDGRFAVAYTNAARPVSGAVAVGENLLALVDLEAAPGDDNPLQRTISSYGGARLGLDVAPEIVVDGTARRLVVVRSVGHVALFDLLDPTADPITVPLVLPGDPISLEPRAARFALSEEGRGGLWVFLTAPGSGDVIELRIGPDPETPGALTARLNQHAVGGWVTRAEPLWAGDGRLYVLALSESAQRLAMIDVDTGETLSFGLEAPYSSLQVFEVADERSVAHPYVLLSDPGQLRFGVLAVDEVSERGVKALHERALRSSYATVLPIPGQSRFLTIGYSRDDTTPLTFVWLDREASEDSVSVVGTIEDYTYTADGAALLLLVAKGGAQHLVRLDLATGLPVAMPLDPGATRLDIVPGGELLVITHDDPSGLLTLVDPNAFERAAAERLHGFMLDGMLGR